MENNTSLEHGGTTSDEELARYLQNYYNEVDSNLNEDEEWEGWNDEDCNDDDDDDNDDDDVTMMMIWMIDYPCFSLQLFLKVFKLFQ